MTTLYSTVTDTALVIEGGGMRGAYTAGVLDRFLAEGIFFDYVVGISAGSSHTLNYTSRDRSRLKAAFVDVADYPDFFGWKHWMKGNGYFNAQEMYQNTVRPDGPLPFDLETFHANPATVRIGVYDATAGKDLWFGKEDMASYADIARIARGSSTLPVLMPPQTVNGHVWFDGALSRNGGIPLDEPMRAGYTKFFVLLTQPRDYMKPPLGNKGQRTLKMAFPGMPELYRAAQMRPSRYNAARKKVFELEAQGRAYVFTPDHMPISRTTMDRQRLEDAFQDGLAQVDKEMPAIRAFLGLD